jgi:hypothetical protein
VPHRLHPRRPADLVAGLRGYPEWLRLLGFFWGNLLLVLAGVGLDLVRKGRISAASLFQLDPAAGSWLLFAEVTKRAVDNLAREPPGFRGG